MKKIILSVTFMAFIVNLNAQVGIKLIDKNFPTETKNRIRYIMPAILQQKNNFNTLLKYWDFGYLQYLMTSDDSSFFSNNDNRTGYMLVPDTCLRIYTDGEDEGSGWLMGMGMIFDPYSLSWTSEYTSGILPTPPDYTYPYKLDTLIFNTLYYKGKGYNTSSPDTLRIYISHYPVYAKTGLGSDFYIVYFSFSSKDSSYLAPIVSVASMGTPKGGSIEPVIDNTIIIDYVLTEDDFSRDSVGEDTYYYYHWITVPLTLNGVTEDGFEVPSGDVVSTMVKFIPGYDYQLGDTLYYGLTDPNNPEYYDTGYPVFVNNVFKIAGFEYSSEHKVFADPFGYNGGLMETKYLHYQMYDDPESGSMSENTIFYPMFGKGFNFIPEILYAFSVDGSDISKANELVSKIYPNPAKDNISINLKNNGITNIYLYNVLGQEVKKIATGETQAIINVSDLKSGLYIVKVKQNGKSFTSKISIQ